MIQPWWFPVKVLDRQTFAADMLFNGATEENFTRENAGRRVVRLQGVRPIRGRRTVVPAVVPQLLALFAVGDCEDSQLRLIVAFEQ